MMVHAGDTVDTGDRPSQSVLSPELTVKWEAEPRLQQRELRFHGRGDSAAGPGRGGASGAQWDLLLGDAQLGTARQAATAGRWTPGRSSESWQQLFQGTSGRLPPGVG